MKEMNVRAYPDLFENASFFIRFRFVSIRRRRFRSPKTKLFENALQSRPFENTVLLFSCGRVKTELFKKDDATASICYISKHVLDSLGIT